MAFQFSLQKDAEMGPRSYPDLEDPPLVETFLGVEYAPLDNWRIPHFGLLWKEFEPEFETFEDQLPLPSQLDQAPQKLAPQLELMTQPMARCWFLDRTRSRLLQVQNGRFIENWRKVGAAEYPHYEGIRARFVHDWATFVSFLEQQKLGLPAVQICEIAYVNHLEVEGGYAEAHEAFPALRELSVAGLMSPEAFGLKTRYVLPDKRGRLFVEIQRAVRDADGRDILVLALMARGTPNSSAVDDVVGWFDVGRDWIHSAFRHFAAPQMFDKWGAKGG